MADVNADRACFREEGLARLQASSRWRARVQLRFKQVRGVAMAQGVDTALLGDAGSGAGRLVPALRVDGVEWRVAIVLGKEEALWTPSRVPV